MKPPQQEDNIHTYTRDPSSNREYDSFIHFTKEKVHQESRHGHPQRPEVLPRSHAMMQGTHLPNNSQSISRCDVTTHHSLCKVRPI